MTGQGTAGENVLLLRFVKFDEMAQLQANGFLARLNHASREETERAYAQLMAQTGGYILQPWVSKIAAAIMDKLGMKYIIRRTFVATGEQEDVYQNR